MRNALERLLSIFAPVDPGEGVTAILLTLNLFLLMAAYYILKPVREALILGDASPELKTYASAGSAVIFLAIVPIYGKLASRLTRIRLLNGVTAFFTANLLMFYGLSRLRFSLSVVFFVWVGLFNLMLVAQFWAFTNDIYTPQQGKRLFAIIGIGSSLGAIFGAEASRRLFVAMGAYPMMLVAAGILTACMMLTNWAHSRETDRLDCDTPESLSTTEGAFQLVFKHRYLSLIALLVVLSNMVNTTGEFMLSKSVSEHAARTVMAGGGMTDKQQYIGEFYANFYLWVNVIGAGLQMFAVSRLMKYIGIGPCLFFLPITALAGYSLLSFMPLLSFLRVTKIAENGADYSLQNTARQALFLPTSRDAKYKGGAAINSFFWRAGDALSAVVVFIGTTLAFDLRTFARTNTILAIVWLCVAASIVWLRLKQPQTALP